MGTAGFFNKQRNRKGSKEREREREAGTTNQKRPKR